MLSTNKYSVAKEAYPPPHYFTSMYIPESLTTLLWCVPGIA